MDLVEIFEVIFGALFIIAAILGSREIFGGIFYSRKVRAVVADIDIKAYSHIDGVRYSDGYDRYLAKKRDRKRQKQRGNRKKQRYRDNVVEHISFAYDNGGEIYKTAPKATICPISPSLIDKSAEYNIMVSRKCPWKARLGLFEVLRVNFCSDSNIVMKLFGFIMYIGNFLMLLAADVGLAALGAWIINLGINGIR